MSRKKRKLVLICVDGAEAELVARWGSEGALPNLTALGSTAATTQPEAPPGFGDGAAWSSLFTGTTPARHGRYFRIQPLASDYRLAVFDDDQDYARKPFWSLADARGQKVAVVDMPCAPLLDDMNGMQVVDWLVHDPVKTPRSRPAPVIDELKSQYGALPPESAASKGNASGRSAESIRRYTEQLTRQIDMKQRAIAPLLTDRSWDLIVCGFQEAHDAGHELWHVHDPRHVDHRADLARQTGDPLLDIYAALDQAIGAIAARLDDDDFLVVVGGIGMESCYTGNHLLGEIVAQMQAAHEGPRRLQPRQLRDRYRKLVPRAVRERLKWLSFRTELGLYRNACRRSRFYAVPHTHNAGAIRINLLGREDNGRVRPGVEYAQLCDEICSHLRALVNVETGRPVVAEVIRTREVYAGDQIERLPDLMAVWRRDDPIRVVGGPGLAEIRQLDPRPRTGDHSRRTFAMLRGPGIASGKINGATTMMDIGVSIAAMMGLNIANADGRPIAELSAASLAPH